MARDFFVTLSAAGEQPVVGGAKHLEDWLYAVACERARGADGADEARAWRWDDSGLLDELTFRGLTRQHNHREYVAEDAGGTVYARVTVDVDRHS